MKYACTLDLHISHAKKATPNPESVEHTEEERGGANPGPALHVARTAPVLHASACNVFAYV